MSEIDWYYFSDGRHKGPISEGELKDLLLSGKIPIHTQVWNESTTSQSPASSIEPFRSLMLNDSNLEEQINSLKNDVPEKIPLALPFDSHANERYKHLRVRSLIVWGILGFALVIFLLYGIFLLQIHIQSFQTQLLKMYKQREKCNETQIFWTILS